MKENRFVDGILDSDLYKFTMQNAVCILQPRATCQYRFFNRDNREFPDGFASELKRLVKTFEGFSLSSEDKDFLRERCRFLSPFYLDFLSGYRFDSNEVIIEQKGPDLDIRIEGFWYRTILWEVPLMALISQLYFEFTKEKIVSRRHRKVLNERKAKRFERLGVPINDFGTRRRYSLKNHREVINDFLRYNFLAGTSNLALARDNGIAPIGTQAHEWISACSVLYGGALFANEFSMEKWVDVYGGDLGIVLTDTFGTTSFLNNFSLKYAKLFDGVRHDSGDPILFARRIVSHYESLGINPLEKVIVFSDGLDFEQVKRISGFCNGKIKSSFGVGTNLTNDVVESPLNIVIKLISVNGLPTVKLSDNTGKVTGEKRAVKLAISSLKNNEYYVYILLDPRKDECVYGDFAFSNEPFYVGKGKGQRAESHSKTTLKCNTTNLYKNNKVKKILDENQCPIVLKIAERLSETEAFELERYLIEMIGRKHVGGPLTNICSGGLGGSGRKLSSYTKERISKSLKGKTKGRKLSVSWKRKISENNAKFWLGKKCPPLTQKQKEKISKALKGRPKTKYKLTSPGGEEIVVFGLKEICSKYNLNSSHLVSVAKGKRKHHKGWKCEYLTKPQR